MGEFDTGAPGGGTDGDATRDGVRAIYAAVPRALKVGTLLVLVVALAVLVAVWHDFYFHWFEVHTGTVNESGPYYGFWSGFGSDIGEATLVVGVGAAWRHHNCHVKGCPRLGRPVPGTPYVACPRHHPAHAGTSRSVSLAELVRAHEAARRESHGTGGATVTPGERTR